MARTKRPPRRLPRPERQGGTAANGYTNISDGRRCVAMKADADLQQIVCEIAAAVGDDGRVDVVDGDGREFRVWPVDAKEKLMRGSATLKGMNDA